MKSDSGNKPGKGRQISKINPFLWFNNEAEEAVKFYCSVFQNSEIHKTVRYDAAGSKASGMPEGTVLTISFRLEDLEFGAINGGPVFTKNPSVSFYVNCKTNGEIDELWGKLSEGGTVMMNLDRYAFSERYGWVQDRFGVSWQLIKSAVPHKMIPCLMFVGPQQGKAEEAMMFYTRVFRDSDITMNVHYEEGQTDMDATVVHGEFLLAGQPMIAMDSAVEMDGVMFNEAISMAVNCESQEEVDYYWKALGEGGDEAARQCGWLRDKFGFSWQVVPVVLPEMLSDPDPVKAGRVMAAMLRMKKIDIGVLQDAYAG